MKNFVYRFTQSLPVCQKPGFVGTAKEKTCKSSEKKGKLCLRWDSLIVFFFKKQTWFQVRNKSV